MMQIPHSIPFSDKIPNVPYTLLTWSYVFNLNDEFHFPLTVKPVIKEELSNGDISRRSSGLSSLWERIWRRRSGKV